MENNNLEWKIEKTLNSLDGIQRADSNPFLYTRIKAAIDEQNAGWGKLAGLFSRPAWALSISAGFIALNLWVAVNREHQQPVAAASMDGEQALSAEYATVNYNMPDLNTNDK